MKCQPIFEVMLLQAEQGAVLQCGILLKQGSFVTLPAQSYFVDHYCVTVLCDILLSNTQD